MKSNFNRKEVKQNKNFMYNDFRKSNIYSAQYTSSNFDFTSFRGAHFKSCNFFECTFKYAEFVGTNFKKSKFKRCKFENAIFEGVNLSEVDFKDAKFKNVIFVATDLSEAKNLEYNEKDVEIYESMPEIEISEELKSAINIAMKNNKIKSSRVLDTKDGTINTISVIRLLDKFDEETLIKGLKLSFRLIDKDFCTLSYIVKAIEKYKVDELI